MFYTKNRKTEGDFTEDQMFVIAPSRNRAVYPCPSGQAGIAGAFLGTFLGKQKGTKSF